MKFKAIKVKYCGTNSNNLANFGQFLHFLIVLGLKTLLFDLYFICLMGRDRILSRQDKTRNQGQFKTGLSRQIKTAFCFQDKTRLTCSLKSRFETSQDFQIFQKFETRRDKTACLVLSWPGFRDKKFPDPSLKKIIAAKNISAFCC